MHVEPAVRPPTTGQPPAPRRRYGVRTIVLGVLLLMGGCSVVGTLYERLDLLLGLEADSWLELDAEQLQRFRDAVRQRVEQNRREELPHYITALELAATRVESPPDAQILLADAERLRLLLRDTIRRSLPLLADTLAGLRSVQVEHLAGKFDESNEEYAEDYLDVAPETFRKKRVRGSRQAVERWTGRLDAAQRAEVASLVDAIPDGSAAWDRYSREWQQALLADLRAGADKDRLLALMEHWWTTDAAMDPAYVTQLEDNRRIIAERLARLLPTLSDRQRRHAAREFRELASDLRELLHPPESGTPGRS